MTTLGWIILGIVLFLAVCLWATIDTHYLQRCSRCNGRLKHLEEIHYDFMMHLDVYKCSHCGLVVVTGIADNPNVKQWAEEIRKSYEDNQEVPEGLDKSSK